MKYYARLYLGQYEIKKLIRINKCQPYLKLIIPNKIIENPIDLKTISFGNLRFKSTGIIEQYDQEISVMRFDYDPVIL